MDQTRMIRRSHARHSRRSPQDDQKGKDGSSHKQGADGSKKKQKEEEDDAESSSRNPRKSQGGQDGRQKTSTDTKGEQKSEWSSEGQSTESTSRRKGNAESSTRSGRKSQTSSATPTVAQAETPATAATASASLPPTTDDGGQVPSQNALPASNSASESGNKPGKWLPIGVGIGIAVLLLLAVMPLIFRRRRKLKRERATKINVTGSSPSSGNSKFERFDDSSYPSVFADPIGKHARQSSMASTANTHSAYSQTVKSSPLYIHYADRVDEPEPPAPIRPAVLMSTSNESRRPRMAPPLSQSAWSNRRTQDFQPTGTDGFGNAPPSNAQQRSLTDAFTRGAPSGGPDQSTDTARWAKSSSSSGEPSSSFEPDQHLSYYWKHQSQAAREQAQEMYPSPISSNFPPRSQSQRHRQPISQQQPQPPPPASAGMTAQQHQLLNRLERQSVMTSGTLSMYSHSSSIDYDDYDAARLSEAPSMSYDLRQQGRPSVTLSG